ncbi:hypothetical protein K438DRAFT_1749265 [Mycena galopus ATCC 62051]|nr:hypothetical protein K438DRAFT_1749265 [Mycena galopus ATCC 62051]
MAAPAQRGALTNPPRKANRWADRGRQLSAVVDGLNNAIFFGFLDGEQKKTKTVREICEIEYLPNTPVHGRIYILRDETDAETAGTRKDGTPISQTGGRKGTARNETQSNPGSGGEIQDSFASGALVGIVEFGWPISTSFSTPSSSPLDSELLDPVCCDYSV